jgi:hypothetical protein
MQALLHIISLIISELSGDFLSCNVKWYYWYAGRTAVCETKKAKSRSPSLFEIIEIIEIIEIAKLGLGVPS